MDSLFYEEAETSEVPVPEGVSTGLLSSVPDMNLSPQIVYEV